MPQCRVQRPDDPKFSDKGDRGEMKSRDVRFSLLLVISWVQVRSQCSLGKRVSECLLKLTEVRINLSDSEPQNPQYLTILILPAAEKGTAKRKQERKSHKMNCRRYGFQRMSWDFSDPK
jgi:hypothetical protein